MPGIVPTTKSAGAAKIVDPAVSFSVAAPVSVAVWFVIFEEVFVSVGVVVDVAKYDEEDFAVGETVGLPVFD